jgi:type II secretory pathway pseudopilin PulG
MIKNLTYRHLIISITLVIISVLVGIVVWQYQINTLQNRQQKEVSEIIANVIQEQSKKDLLLPKIVFINIDSSIKKEIDKKLTAQISDLLTKKYLSDDKTEFKDINLKPFFVLPKANKQGDYVLSETQLNELKNHIEFLVKQVDIEIDRTKEEVGRDIDRLNMWVTIWIGVIGFLGIFIPLIINIDTAKSAERAIEKSNEAITKINLAQSKIDKIEGIETRVNDAVSKIGGVESKTKEADKKANDAKTKAGDASEKAENALIKTKETENILTAISAIGNLKDIDTSTLQYISNPMEVVIKTLHSIHLGLSNCNNQSENNIVKDCLRQLGVKLQLLTFYKFIKREQTELINKFSNSISDKLNNDYDQTKFNGILEELKTLADNLNT